jgi:microcystin-dependent protein
MAEPFLGQLLLVPYNFAPNGWQFCQGQTLAISQFSALFALIGTTYGGNGTTTFQLPNLQGRVPISSGTGAGLQTYVLGEIGGHENTTLLTQNLPAHNHTLMATNAPGNTAEPAGNTLAKGGTTYNSAAPSVGMNAGSISMVGNNIPFDNRMPYLVLNWVIAMVGIFPSRN